MSIAALIVAAGRGSRAAGGAGLGAGQSALPKQYVEVAGRPVIARTIAAFLAAPVIQSIQVVIHADDRTTYRDSVATNDPRLRPPVPGGATRQDSVRLGLEALAPLMPSHVLIHDAARPFLDADVVARVVEALGRSSAAIAAMPVADTLKRAEAAGLIVETVDRAGLWRAQTPQGFAFDAILDAHRRAHAAGRSDFTDDAAIAEWAGLSVALVTGSERNIKLTTAEDIAMADRVLSAQEAGAREVRTGMGFDVHRFSDGNSVWLCGVEIPHTHRLEGHSDADVGLHALTDALLGAIGSGDIGHHFPPSDQRWKGAASHIFLAHAGKLVAERGGRVVNVDVTILAEAPKVSPHRAAMCTRIGEILGIAADRVAVKATTTEGLGFTGRREGIAAQAIATITLPAAAD